MDKKDIIEDIKSKLMDSSDLPYKDGAWERFSTQYNTAAPNRVVWIKKWSSIAAIGLLLIGASIYWNNNRMDTDQEIELVNNSEFDKSTVYKKKSTDNYLLNNNSDSIKNIENNIAYIENNTQVLSNNQLGTKTLLKNEVKQAELILSTIEPQSVRINSYTSLEDVQDLPINKEDLLPSNITPVFDDTNELVNQVSSYKTLADNVANSTKNIDAENLTNQSKMSIGDKLQLGLYVSPHRTSDQFDVGAGFLISFSVNKRLSIRTGSSYNSYSVGEMKDPMKVSNAEVVSISDPVNHDNVLSRYSSNKTQMLLPNINAVMGKVESIEIPLEVSYQFNKGIYTTAGLSYSAIIGQQRQAEFYENGFVRQINDDPQSIPQSAQQVVNSQTITVKSLQDNVNPKGYNGFVNFSVGKKINVGRTIGLSLEPFVKVPIGEFRKSDLDYTNSGVRIITTF